MENKSIPIIKESYYEAVKEYEEFKTEAKEYHEQKLLEMHPTEIV